MAMQISGVTIQGGMNILSPGGSPSPSPSYSFQGSNFGFSTGLATPTTTYIDKFSLSSDTDATDVGDLSRFKINLSSNGQSSSSSGHVSAGAAGGTGVMLDDIDKFAFTSNGNATDVADLVYAIQHACGHSSSNHGYCVGGRTDSPNSGYQSSIQKFPFSSDANATDSGDLTQTRYQSVEQTSSTHGYVSSGFAYNGGGSLVSGIDKFAFASDSNGSDVGDLYANKYNASGQSSSDNGYASGGAGSAENIIQKFPFASDGNSTDVGDLNNAGSEKTSGQSSTTTGHSSGGKREGASLTARIEKFPFASDTNASIGANLTISNEYASGLQY